MQEVYYAGRKIVTSNGRESVVLLPATEYAELKKYRDALGDEITDEFMQ